jgi:hypothetical protein
MLRPKPQKAAAVLKNAKNSVLRKPLFNGDMFKLYFRILTLGIGRKYNRVKEQQERQNNAFPMSPQRMADFICLI